MRACYTVTRMSLEYSHEQSETVGRTYALDEAARIICGNDDPASLHWLKLRLRGAAEPAMNGYKVARRWRMTQADVDAAITKLRPATAPATTSMTARSRRRIAV